jgi:RNA polymerase sigma-70 factor (ECF subfamily)
VAASRQELEALYRDRYLGFRRALAATCGSYELAHDVVQEAFARALAQRHRYRGDAPLGAWVWGIAAHVVREQRRGVAPAPLGEVVDGEVIDSRLAGPAHDPGLDDVLRALPPRRRLIVFLRYFADLSYAEIAAVCKISEGTVAASIAQARASIAETLEREATAEARAS